MLLSGMVVLHNPGGGPEGRERLCLPEPNVNGRRGRRESHSADL